MPGLTVAWCNAIVKVMRNAESPIQRPCGHCCGTGKLPVSPNLHNVLAVLARSQQPLKTAELYRKMPKPWRRRHGRTNMNNILVELMELGVVTRMRADRGYKWAAR